MKNKNIIAVFGGSFNPPANSHLHLAREILNNLNEVEKIIFVPVNVKYNKNGLISNEKRYEMLKKICNNNPKLEVSDIEINSDRQLYTIETLRILQKQYEEKEICFILGTDNLKELKKWHEVEKLLETFKIIVLERGEEKAKDIIEKDSLLKKYSSSFIMIPNIERIDLSSTKIREKIKQRGNIENLVPIEILEDVLKLYS